MKKNLFWILLSVLFCACSEQNIGNEYFLRGQEVKFASGNENLWPIYISGRNVFATANDISFHVGKITKKEWQKAERISGEGTNNDLEWLRFSQGNNGELFMLNLPVSSTVFKGNLKSLIKIPNAVNIATIKDQTKWETYDLKNVSGFAPTSLGYVALSDTTILIAGMVENDIKRVFSVIDFKNQKFTPLDYWPKGGGTSDTTKCMQYVSNCTILGNGKGKVLYQNPWAKLAFIFKVDGTKVNKLSDLYTDTLTPTRPTECLSCCANGDRIYMLVRDYNTKGKESTILEIFGNTVEVFDWDGVKQQVIHLDNYYKEIMLSGDGNTLFLHPGMTEDIIKPALYSYDISNLKDNPMIDSVEIAKICKANAEKTLEKYGKKRSEYVAEGDMMVDFELYDYDDKPHHLNEFLGKGKYTILEFSNTGCGPCQMARPHLEKFYKQNKDKVEMITISEDKLSEWKKKPLGEVSWHEWNDHNMAIDIQKKYDVQGTPTFFVITPEGKIVKKLVGFNEARIDEIKDIISGKK